MRKDVRLLLIFLSVFLLFYFVPFKYIEWQKAILEGLFLTHEYAREHALFCLVPALFIAGALSCFISQSAVLKYFGAQAKKVLAYSVASISGAILAVCSCTVLPLFAGIYTHGAGLGPATAFLYSGPAINILAIILTAKVLGLKLGLARVVFSILFALLIGLTMSFVFSRKEKKCFINCSLPEETPMRPLWQNTFFIFSLVGMMVFAAWAKPKEGVGFWLTVYRWHWPLAFGFLLFAIALILKLFKKGEIIDWFNSTWFFAKQILPLLFFGVLVAGILFGRPQTDTGLIPASIIAKLVGGNSLEANFFASIVGALMYFATLTEVPILQGLLGSGMGEGPALALLLAGPALSLPTMLVIVRIMGIKRAMAYIILVVIFSSLAGLLYGSIS
jgi:hypothetical protein